MDQSTVLNNLERTNEEVAFKTNLKVAGQQIRRRSSSSLKGAASSSAPTSLPWKLKYKDFLPVTNETINLAFWERAESFHKLVDQANQWLKKSPDVVVTSCESITWVSHDRSLLGDGEMMMLTKSVKEKTCSYFVRGLRIWLSPNTIKQKTTCHLSFHDVTPDNNENVPDLVAKANKKLMSRSLKGNLVTVETVNVPVLKGGFNASMTRWSEKADEDCANIFVLRMFVVKETHQYHYHHQRRASLHHQQPKLALKDIVPIKRDDDSYDDYETLVDKANEWMKENQNEITRIVSMQSVMVQKHEGPQENIGDSCKFYMPGIHNPAMVEFFRLLRIIYFEGKHNNEQTNNNKNNSNNNKMNSTTLITKTLTTPFLFETFSPEVVWSKDAGDGSGVKVERIEKMKELFSKIMAYLRNTGCDVLGVETVLNPMQVYVDECALGQLYTDQEIKFLFTIRLYLTPQSNPTLDPTRPIRRASFQPLVNQQLDVEGGADNKSTNERRPLFLRNVVGRQYKYRWVVLAISAFTCMAIIVVVSVVYSNR